MSWFGRIEALSSTVIHAKWLMIWPDGQGLGSDKIEGLRKGQLGEEACDQTLSMDPAS